MSFARNMRLRPVAALGFALWSTAAWASLDKDGWHVDGILDSYYQVDFAYPHVHGLLPGRAEDAVRDHLELANAQLNINRKPTAKCPWGLTTSLQTGRDADLTHITDPAGSSRYETFLQAYVSYLCPGKTAVTIDAGKFLPLIGYESTNTYDNDNYGGSALSAMGQPAYHVGVRATAVLSPKSSASVYFVNGWNDVEDSNGGKSVGVTYNWNPDAKTTFSLNYLGGDEGGRFPNDAASFGGIGFTSPGTRHTDLFDGIATYQANDKLSWAFDACYVRAEGLHGASSGQWQGGLLAMKYAFSPTWAGILRAETFQDEQGLLTGLPLSIDGFTGTLVYTFKGGSQFKVEYRHENANLPFFDGGKGPTQYRDTLCFAQIVRF